MNFIMKLHFQYNAMCGRVKSIHPFFLILNFNIIILI